jgi:uncharacterized membrane protein
MAAGVISLPGLYVTGLPAGPAWPWLIGGVIINSLGIRASMEAYKRAPYGLAYPIMRAGIPLMALPIGFVLLGEFPGGIGAVGVLMIAGALVLLALAARREGADVLRGVAFAFAASAAGAGYVAADAMGVRLSGDVMGYAFTVAVGNGLVLAAMTKFEGHNPVRMLRQNARIGFGISLISMTSFLLYVAALAVSPVALASALRETSVLFATAIAAFVLKERIGVLHWSAAGLALAGVALIRFA